MAGKIRLLDKNLINKIAAGEVVERPASVVKELIENSIDAGPERIRIAIKAGGKQSIVVADDGLGMGREDIKLCVHRHATSKMTSATDLFQISTLGFRGEALASIGAVAHLAIESRTQGEDEGTRMVVEGGLERELHGIARARGTTITVRNLFFNIPARRKFMRHVDTETRHISQAVIHLAAGYPEIGFELENHERITLSFSPANRIDRAVDIFGLEGSQLLDVEYKGRGIVIEGVLAKPEHYSRSKGKQYMIVRGRPIYSRPLIDAVYRGLGGLLPGSQHPVFMLWLDMDPRKIDVNVHPTKREVRLAEEALVVECIEESIRKSLDLPDTRSFIYGEKNTGFRPVLVGEPAPIKLEATKPEADKYAPNEIAGQLSFALVAPSVVSQDKTKIPGLDSALRELMLNQNFWQVHNQFIIVQIEEGLLFVDQQAAHERILFEGAMTRISAVERNSQQLLFPLKLEMGASDYQVFEEVRDYIQGLGFVMRDFGERTALVEAIPVELENWGEGDLFYQMLNDARDGHQAGRDWSEAMVLAYVRRISIKKGQKLKLEEIERIIAQLQKAKEPYVSPDGKPIMTKIRLSDIERLFKKL